MNNITFWRVNLEHYNQQGSAALGIVSVIYEANITNILIEDSNLGIFSGIDASGDIDWVNMTNIIV